MSGLGAQGRLWGIGIVAGAAALAAVLWFASPGSEGLPALAEAEAEQGRIAVAGLRSELRIDRDRNGVPQVDAGSDSDAFFGLGFSHGQDRLGQLLQLRLHAQGRAAEQLGAAALDADRVARLIGFAALADRQWEQLPESAREVLESYAAGVNARLELVRDGRVAAPAGVDAGAIRPWRPQDSLALFKLFSWNLGASVDVGLVLQALVGELGAAEAGRFFPPRAAGGRGGGSAAAEAPWLGTGLQALRRFGGLEGQGVGSTAFVLGGAHTESGLPILVADSHTTPTVPAVFYLAALRAPGLDVAGLSLPGIPIFWSGRNAQLAWASVHTGAVVADLYVETLRKDGAEFHDGRRWKPVEVETTTLFVRGGVPVEFSARRTARGPLLPHAQDVMGETISVAWTGARVDGPSGIASLLEVARAQTGPALREALREHHEPVVAVVWADAEGAAGLQTAGWIPRRSLASQLVPLPGRAAWYHWDERVPFDGLPTRELDAGEGFLVAADQRFQHSEDADPIDTVWRPGVRSAHLVRRLAEWVHERPDLRSLASLQVDTGLPRSQEVVSAALTLAGDDLPGREAREMARLLVDWDGRAQADSVGCAAYHVFLDLLARALFEERLGPLFERYLELPSVDIEGLVHAALLDAAAGGRDGWTEPEAVQRAVATSLREAWLALSFRSGPDPRRWVWGALHELRFEGREELSKRLGTRPYGGAPHALLAAGYAAARPFRVQVAATARLAMDLAAPDLMIAALAPGQSERPGHRNFESGLDGWLEGRLGLIVTRRVEVEEQSVAQLVLEPLH